MQNDILAELDQLLEQRKTADAEHSYTANLFQEGLDSILKKVGEESIEVIIASKSGHNGDIVHEIADLWFHCMVLLKQHGLDVDDVRNELKKRFGLSGLEEKANRNKQ